MIISVSRRTDIPAFYGEQFLASLKKGFIEFVNPFNKKTKIINILPDQVDCIVFWSKNYIPFMDYLSEIEKMGYKFYLNYTVNNYERKIENINNSNDEIIENLLKLSEKYTIFWRYDPILITDEMDENFHINNFSYLSKIFSGKVNRVIINFLQEYKKSINRLKKANINNRLLSDMEKINLASKISNIAAYNKIPLYSCSKILYENNITLKSNCVDKDTIEKITGKNIEVKICSTYDGCNCYKSIDVGIYSTCKNCCLYCYAY